MPKSRNKYGCPECGTKTTMNFQEPRIRNIANWSEHRKPDGTRCPKSGRRVHRVRHDYE